MQELLRCVLPSCRGRLWDHSLSFRHSAIRSTEESKSGRWFRIPRHGGSRRVERGALQRASGVVSLTELAAEDVRSGRFGRPHPKERSICIPTCVDYTKFTMDEALLRMTSSMTDRSLPTSAHSIHRTSIGKSSPLTALILNRIPEARFPALTSQVSEISTLADENSPSRQSADSLLASRTTKCIVGFRRSTWPDDSRATEVETDVDPQAGSFSQPALRRSATGRTPR